MADIQSVSILFKVEGKETFTNEWKVQNISLDKVRKLELLLIELQSKIQRSIG